MLTARERDLVRLLRAGKSYKEAAKALDISINTARTYIQRAYAKLGVSSRYRLPRL